MQNPACWNLPLLRSVDCLVVGGSVAAVAAALELSRRGRRVLVVADRPYLGEELAGALALTPEAAGAGDDPLLRALEARRAGGVLFPAAIKQVLESALMEAGVGFLFAARPVALLRGEGGGPEGLVIAHRSSLLGVRAGAILDATAHGLVPRLAGTALAPARVPADRVDWRVVATEAPRCAAASGPDAEFLVAGEKAPVPVALYRLNLERPAGDSRERLHRLRAAVLDPAIRQFADLPLDPGVDVLARAGALADEPAQLPDSAFVVEPGLWVLGGVLPLTRAGALASWASRAQCALGRRVAALVARLERREPAAGGALRAQAGDGTRGGLDFAPAYLRAGAESLSVEAPLFPDWGAWDVVVAGGGTGGAAAGVAAARQGARTLVVETLPMLGGVGTAGLISQYWFGRREGYTRELDERLQALDPGRKSSSRWNPELKAGLHHRMLAEAGGVAWMESLVCAVRREGGRVRGLLISTPYGCGVLSAGCVVDATGSADVAAAAGAPCRVTGRAHAAVQGTGLSPRSPGRDYCNSDHTFVDDLDPVGVTHAHAKARAKFSHEFDVAPIVDSRERRQIVGDVEITPLDLLAKRSFPDTVCSARSNFDSHGFTVHPVFMLVAPDKRPLEAQIPLRCMLPRGLDGVVVTGLGMSAHRDALPVIRMQADVQNQGFAAGVVAARSAATARPLRELAIGEVQGLLAELGVIDPAERGRADSFPLPRERVEAAVAALGGHEDAAVLFAHREEARELLRRRLAGEGEKTPEAVVLALGLMGDASAAEALLRIVREEPWDEGWNFRGMDQFGASLSRMDVAVIALGRTRHPEAQAAVAAKIRALGEDAAFSHARAVGVAAVCLRREELAEPLRELLMRPGLRGHVEDSTERACANAIEDRTENTARCRALRELYLARGLLACGDGEGLAREILGAYARDLRGVFARHARDLLEQGVPDDVLEVA